MKAIKRLAWIIFIPVMFTVGCNRKGIEKPDKQPTIDTVIIRGMQFHPDTLLINKGDAVVWVNHGLVKHYVAAFPDRQWKSGTIPPDSSWKMVFKKAWNYYCYIHPTMKGKIIIK